MLESGYIKLHRKMTQWEWYTDTNTTMLFIHLLLTVNYEDKKWQGKVIKRGQRVCSYSVLSKELKLSVRSIRTSLNKLKMTGEVTSETTSKYSLISIVNYDLYQDERQAKGQSGDKQPTSKRQATDNNERKIKKDKKDKEYINIYIGVSENEKLVEALAEFEKMRDKIKKPMTERARQIFINKLNSLAKTDDEKIELLNTAILNNWLSVYPPKGEKKNDGNTKSFEGPEIKTTRL